MQDRRRRGLTHLDARGRARMVDVGDKPITRREAVARGELRMKRETIAAIAAGTTPKGDVVAAARLAGILGAKRTHELVPLCHPLPLSSIDVDVELDRNRSRVRLEARVATEARTGVEMEAMTAVTVAGLTVYDMVKAIDRGVTLERVRLVAKSGGKSGAYRRPRE